MDTESPFNIDLVFLDDFASGNKRYGTVLRSVGKRRYRLNFQITSFLVHGSEHLVNTRLKYLPANK